MLLLESNGKQSGEQALLNWLRPTAAAVCHLLVWCCFCTAQEVASPAAPEKTKPTAAAESTPGRVEEVRPSVYYLPDKQGNLQPVLDFKYQDFVELYKLKSQLERRDQPPRYSLQRMSVTGTAGADHADLTVQFQVLVRDDGWVRVPLRLDQSLLRGEVQHRGAGEQFVHFESDGQGYVCWIRGKADSQHEITLTVLAPLATVGEETRLKLFVPRATASELKLTVPIAAAVAKVSDGATLLPPVAGEKATELTVVGLGGELQLTWHKPDLRAAEAPAVLEAVGAVLARLDGRSIVSEAALTVRSYGAAFDRFLVRLPPEAQLSAGSFSGYTVTPVETDGEPPSEPRLVEVRLAKKTTGAVEVHLNCRRPLDPASSPSFCELGGFEVVGAARQSGIVTVEVGGDWQMLWGPSRETRQIDQIPDSLRHDDVVAGFEYSSQPYSLTARLIPRKTRVSVEPEYVLLVDCDEVRLEGKLTYTVRGAKVAALQIMLPEWELGEVGPDSLVAVDGVTMDPLGLVTIPLAQSASGKIELSLRARQAIKAGAGTLAVQLPQPLAAAAAPAAVVVVPADNVELIPNSAALGGLVDQRTAPPMKLPDRQQVPLFYRVASGSALFAAELRTHTRRVTVDVSSQLTFNRQSVAVEQKFAYAVAYEPVDRLTVDVPAALPKFKRLEFLYDGKQVSAVAASRTSSRDMAEPAAPMAIALPRPRIGPCELVVRYTVPLPEPTTKQSRMLTVPLPMPRDGEIIGNKVSVTPGENLQVAPRKGPWTAVENDPARAERRAGLLLTAAKRVAKIDLEMRWEDVENPGFLFVDRAWVQSWLTYSARQDRTVYQFVTRQKELEVTLPAGAATGQMPVLLDGQRVECRSPAENRLLVPLASEGQPRRYVLELYYHFPDARPPRGLLDLEFARLGGDAWLRRMYWQLVLPRNEHVIANPEGFTGEFDWGWQGYFWGRQPLLDQAQLESWVGASSRSSLPEGCNLYLYSALGKVNGAELRTAGRSWIVLWASGAALVAGLLLIYVPASRHPATLLAATMVLLGVGAIAPEPTLLVAQAASLGLVLTLLAGLLERGVRRRRRRATIQEPSSPHVELGSSRLPRPPTAAGSPSSTQAMPAISPQATGDAET